MTSKRLIRKVYLEVWRGDSAYFISEHYQLQATRKDTQRDTFFLNRDILDFRSRADIFNIMDREYVVLFMCDMENKEAFIKNWIALSESGKIRGVSFNG